MHRTLTLCKRSEHFFQELFSVTTANLKMIFENPRELYLKEKCLTRMFATQANLLKDGFLRWVMNYRSDKMSKSLTDHKKILMINQFTQLLHKRGLV
jgi:hypothetical protein